MFFCCILGPWAMAIHCRAVKNSPRGTQRIFCLVVCIDPYFISAEIVFKICFWSSLGYLSVPTEYIFYCKRANLFLSSSKILTPHPPLRPASLSSPCNKGGGYTLSGLRGGWGVNILEDERNRIALLQ